MNLGLTPAVAPVESMASATVAFKANAVNAVIKPTMPPPVAMVARPRVLGATERAPEAAEEPQERSPAQTGQERPGLYRGRVVRVVRRDLPDGVIRARR